MKVHHEVYFGPESDPDVFLQAQGKATLQAMQAVAEGLKADWRAQIVAAGLGTRLANTIRSTTYPGGSARGSLDPTAFVWTKAPTVISAYAYGAAILPTGGRKYLAIPTANVPFKGRGRKMTPQDVAASFGQDLIILPRGDGHLLAFVNAIQAKSLKGWRRATPGRLARGRAAKLVLMFVLVPQVRVAKKLDLDALADKWSGRVPELIDQAWPEGSVA